jgi:hypothetical protein
MPTAVATDFSHVQRHSFISIGNERRLIVGNAGPENTPKKQAKSSRFKVRESDWHQMRRCAA